MSNLNTRIYAYRVNIGNLVRFTNHANYGGNWESHARVIEIARYDDDYYIVFVKRCGGYPYMDSKYEDLAEKYENEFF